MKLSEAVSIYIKMRDKKAQMKADFDASVAPLTEKMDKLEAKRAGQEKDDSQNELINFFAKAGQSQKQNFFAAMGEGAESTGKLTKENAALRDKQATEIIAARQAMETAEDARKRGDMAGSKAAQKDAENRLEKAAELGNQFDLATASLEQAGAATTNAASGQINAASGQINAATGMTNAQTSARLAQIQWDEKDSKISLNKAQAWHWMHPQASAEQVKANHIAIIKQEHKNKTGKTMSHVDALAALSMAQGAVKSELLDDRNAQANSALWDKDPMVRMEAKKSFGKDGASTEVIRKRWLESRTPGYTPSSGKIMTQAEVNALPSGSTFTGPDGVPRIKP